MAFDRYAKLFSLQDKMVMVAGGTGAIGSAMARAAAGFGAKIAIAGFDEHRRAKIVAELREEGVTATGVFINVLDIATVKEGLAEAERALGPIDVLINTVGTHIEQPAEEVTLEAWDKVMDVNLRGAFILSQAAAQSMIAHQIRGSIIHVTSVRSNLGIRRGYAAYVASKGGLAILIKQLATEWAKYGIRVNGIAPTFTRTALVADYLEDPNFYNALVSRIPLGRVAETDDLVGLAVFLASEASSMITGQNIFVDGGITATQ
ncbi:MAG: SDR family oxidoreductase [Chloroflexi bacterium]|nr:SDR family oxidoreductase [Chloroflexota bacterium]